MLSPQHLSSDERFRLLLDAASDYAIFFTEPDGSISEWSSSAQKLLGYSEDEALRLNGRAIFTPEDRGRDAPELEMETAARDGQANDERWHVRKDGSLFFAVGRLVALRNAAGQLVGFAKIIRDATPHKTLEQALRLSDEQFRATFAQAPVGMAITDLEGRIRQVNATMCRLIGYPDRELEGRELVSLTVPEDRDAAVRQIQELLSGSRTHILIDKRIMRSDGTPFWVQNSGALLRDGEGRPISFIDLFQDISALKLSEAELGRMVSQRTAALEQKTRQMESFCYTVAHDLRAPLRAITGYANILREDFGSNLAPEGLDYIHRIGSAAARLDRLIADLLGYTRVEQVALVREEVDLTEMAQRVVEQMKDEAQAADATIRVQAPLGVVRADRVTVEHVFINLLSNALKFRRDDAPLSVRIYSEERGERMRVWVEDNGIGIDPRFYGRVFGMFERLHPDRKIPGTGVGLAIVATAMERLGGSRGVEPNQPAGSRFWIEFRK